jgi:hypothetical protein
MRKISQKASTLALLAKDSQHPQCPPPHEIKDKKMQEWASIACRTSDLNF